LKRTLAVLEKSLGPDHPNVAFTLNNLGEVYRAQGRYAAAAPLYPRALAIAEKRLGPDHPTLAALLDNYAVVLRGAERDVEALEAEERARDIRARHSQQQRPR
jgi:tetratricopeptide (TPR) repeat protein